MGCKNSKVSQKQNINSINQQKAIDLFHKIDLANNNVIDPEECTRYWSQNFSKLNSKIFFQQIDQNGDGKVSIDEWLSFWNNVKHSGHTDEEISQELDRLLQGDSFTFTFLNHKREQKNKNY